MTANRFRLWLTSMSDHIFLYDQIQQLKGRVTALEDRMSAVDDRLAAFEKSVDDEIARIQATNDAHAAEVERLKADVAGGVLTPAQRTAFDRIQAKIDAADLTNPATIDDVPTGGTDTTTGGAGADTAAGGAGTDTTAGGAGPAP